MSAFPPPPAAPAAAATPPRLHWAPGPTPGDWVLQLQGDWRGSAPGRTDIPEAAAPPTTVRLDTTALAGSDADLGATLWPLLAPLHARGVVLDLAALPPETRAALALAQGAPPQDAAAPDTPGSALQRAGGWAQAWWADALRTVSFIGEVLLALARLLRPGHRRVLRSADFWAQFERTGPLSLPIVGLTSFLIGLMLAYMGGAQLARIGGQAFIADVVTVGVVRELAGLMTGFILAGRVGAAFAAQLATMQANEEIDALRTLGIDPVEHLVLPRLLAMLLMAPLLIAYAALVGVLAGLPAASGVYGVPASEYLYKSLLALNWTHVWIGLFKGTMYVLLVALAGCREGLYAGRNAQAVGDATTTAVVKALLWIVVAASASTALFQSLGF